MFFGENDVNKEIEDLFNRFIAEYNESDECGVWVLVPEQVNLLAKSYNELKKIIEGQNAEIAVTVLDDLTKMGSVVITSSDKITFTDTDIIADIARSGAGIDISALNNGDIEIVFGFRTARKAEG